MFIGREAELEQLNQAYVSDTFQLQVIYGRRRVGKTALIQQFIANKPDAHYFIAQQNSEQVNLAQLSEALARVSAQESKSSPAKTDMGMAPFDQESAPVFRTFEAALNDLFMRGARKRIIFVIDEYPYLAACYPGVSSLLQTLIDRHHQTSKLFLILCGSSLSFMEHQVLGEKSPLYGRRTGQINLTPFDAFDAARLLGAVKDPIQAVELYALAGGIPLYLSQLDASQSTEWNISHGLLDNGSLLAIEPDNLLQQETRKPAVYKSALNALASGKMTAREIGDATGLSSSSLHACLDELMSMQLVHKANPVCSGRKHQPRYALKDNLFRFRYSIGLRYDAAIELGMGEQIARAIIANGEFSTYVGHIFEEVCRQWLMREMKRGRLALIPKEIGSWWGTPVRNHPEEVDIVVSGVSPLDGSSTLLVGECKWRNEHVDVSALEKLQERARYVPGTTARTPLYLFSKSGFTEGLARAAREQGNVHLKTVDELFGAARID